jgi:hypothetical protein
MKTSLIPAATETITWKAFSALERSLADATVLPVQFLLIHFFCKLIPDEEDKFSISYPLCRPRPFPGVQR